MASVLTQNNPRARDNRAPAPEVKFDGSNYPWRMFFDNDQRIVDADTTAECLEYLIPDYTLFSDDDKKAARHQLALSVQSLARAAIISKITPEQAEELAGWEWAVLTYGEGDNTDPYGWGDGTGTLGKQDPEVADEWNAPYQLVLLDTSYAPYTDIVRPLSIEGDFKEVRNIIWLRPTGEEEFLRSISNIGYISFGRPSALNNVAEAARANVE